MSFAALMAVADAVVLDVLGDEAFWTPAGGQTLPVRVFPAVATESVNIQGVGPRYTQGGLYELHVNEVERVSPGRPPAKGDKLTVEGVLKTIQGAHRGDHENDIWLLEAR